MKAIRLFTILLFSFFLVSSLQAKTYSISVNQFVEHPALDAVLKGFQDYMKEKNIPVKYKVHNAQANMATANQIAQLMVGEDADMMLAIATPSALACAQALEKAPASKRTTLLFTAVTDPVSTKLVPNLQKPGGYITGVSDLLPVDKHMENVKAIIPELKTLGVLYNAGEPNSKVVVNLIKKEAKRLGFKVIEATASKSSEVYQAAKSLAGRADAVFIPTDNTVISALESALKVGIQYRMPIIAADVDSVARGAVFALGFDYYLHGYQTGAMAERILKGANPGDTAVETQEKLELHLNLKFAKKMGLNFPQSLINKANKVHK